MKQRVLTLQLNDGCRLLTCQDTCLFGCMTIMLLVRENEFNYFKDNIIMCFRFHSFFVFRTI